MSCFIAWAAFVCLLHFNSTLFVMFTFQKPPTWPYMPLFEKIAYYKTVLTKDYAKYVDKIEAKNIVREMAGDLVQCTSLVRILRNPDDIHQSDLNTNHIIKYAHGCGWNIGIEDTTTIQSVKESLNAWNHQYTDTKEMQYSFIEPRFFIEEKLDDSVLGKTAKAIVYLIRCIHGKPFVIGVRTEKGQNSYDLNWNPVKRNEVPNVEKPKQFETMLEIARRLSKQFEFVRIDLYIGKDNLIYFSEFTFTPSGGNMFYTMKREKEFGKLWK